ncbi:MarR family winged helix-turn-helix transcriptional regulator [Modicisalibacter coralii]|uniref:MarR family winged helix-turn-helix transcriptional regulator n=1 Tax=Modicisalibacter coralii TaxID=2304602 RepID=UPI00100B6EEB|nr:MarR family winged helix-turn-helix transcriptional regulator [Halomonas coralii]
MQPIGAPTGTEVSLSAYLAHLRKGYLGRQQQTILLALSLSPQSLTRHQLGERAGMSLSSVCGRVSELLDLDYVEVDGTRKDPGSSSPRTTLRLTEKGRAEAARIVAEVRQG